MNPLNKEEKKELSIEIKKIEAIIKELNLKTDKYISFDEVGNVHNYNIFPRFLNKKNDLSIGLAEAKAHLDSSFYAKLIEAIESKVFQTLMIPTILIMLTALFGNYVGDSLQNSSFKKQRSFDARLESLNKEREEAINISMNFRKCFLEIGAIEYDYDNIKKSNKENDIYELRVKQKLQRKRTSLRKILDEVVKITTNTKNQTYKPYEEIGKMSYSVEISIQELIDCISKEGIDCTEFGLSEEKGEQKLAEFKKPFTELIRAYHEAIDYLYKNGGI